MDDKDFLEKFDDMDDNGEVAIAHNTDVATEADTATNEAEPAQTEQPIQTDTDISTNTEPNEGDSEDPTIQSEPPAQDQVPDTTTPEGANNQETVAIEVNNNVTDYDMLIKPFKANGKEIDPTPEKRLQLMQLGAKYYDDVVKIKPKLRAIKALEQANINDDQLNFAIELLNGNKDAIAKLMHDKELTLEDLENTIETETEHAYVPNNYIPSESEVKFDEIVEKFNNIPEFNEVVSDISGFDDASKQKIIANPEILEVLTMQKQNGSYKQIDDIIKSKLMYGELQGVPYIDAYEQIGMELLQQQASQQQDPSVVQQQQQQQQQQVQKPTPSRAIAPKRDAGTPPKKEYDINALSDEDFVQLFDAGKI